MSARPAPDVTVVIPVYYSAGTLRELCLRLRAVLDSRKQTYELIFVDDASPDESSVILSELAQEGSVIVLRHASNVGQHRAVVTGLRSARGPVVVVLDADLQDPPEAIPLLLDRLSEGFAAVYAARRGTFQPFLRRMTSRIFKFGMNLLADVPRDMGPFVAMDRRMLESVLSRSPERPFIPAVIATSGLPIGAVPVRRLPRPVGQSAYTHRDRLAMGVRAVATVLQSKRRSPGDSGTTMGR